MVGMTLRGTYKRISTLELVEEMGDGSIALSILYLSRKDNTHIWNKDDRVLFELIWDYPMMTEILLK